MALRFNIENETNLPDGGPVTFTVTGKRSVDIGRDQHLDWTLPDQTRFISGKHCEVRYRDGSYWLHDVSTNGTFLNGAEQRMRGPHQLKTGDRFIVGQYIIGVMLDGDGERDFAPPAFGAPAPEQHSSYQELWVDDRGAPPPIDPKQLRIPSEAARPVNAEFLDWAAAVPSADPVPATPQRDRSSPADLDDISWAGAPPPPREPPRQAPLVMPTPSVPTPSVPTPRIQPPGAPMANASAWTSDEAPWQSEAPARPAPVQATPSPAASDPFREAVSSFGADAVPSKPAPALTATDDAFLRTLAAAAGLPDDFFATQNPDQAARQIGTVLRLAVEGVMQLLQARNQAKQMTRSSSHTTVQAVENNPLKFAPTADDALRIMFGPPTRSYLDARSAVTQSFDDLRSHQLKTYMAMQHAVTKLLGGLDPESIASDVQADKGMTSFLSSNKIKSWDAYRERWNANLLRDSGGPISAFMLHFADYYDGNENSGR